MSSFSRLSRSGRSPRESIAGPDFVVTNPRGFWVALYFYSFFAVFSLAAAIPHRAADTVRHPVQANDVEPGVAQVPR